MLAKLHTFSLLGIEAIPVDSKSTSRPPTLAAKTMLVRSPPKRPSSSPAIWKSIRRRHGLKSCFNRPYEDDYADVRGQEIGQTCRS